MASSESTKVPSSYSDKQVVPGIDHGKEVVANRQPYPDAYAYANPNNTNNDSSIGGAHGGGLEAVEPLYANNEAKPAWSEPKPKRRICGLSKRNFIIVIAVVTALAAAAIVGGSVGGVLANNNKSSGSAQAESASSSASSAVTQTSSAASTSTSEAITSTNTPTSSTSSSTSTTSTSFSATPTSGGEGTYDCPADENRSYISSLSSSQSFTILCDTDWPTGADGINGGNVTDLTAVIAYSIDSCVDSCAAYNVAGGSCQAVVYGANITLALSRGGIQGNCFLKDQRGADNVADSSGQVEAAFLASTSG